MSRDFAHTTDSDIPNISSQQYQKLLNTYGQLAEDLDSKFYCKEIVASLEGLRQNLYKEYSDLLDEHDPNFYQSAIGEIITYWDTNMSSFVGSSTTPEERSPQAQLAEKLGLDTNPDYIASSRAKVSRMNEFMQLLKKQPDRYEFLRSNSNQQALYMDYSTEYSIEGRNIFNDQMTMLDSLLEHMKGQQDTSSKIKTFIEIDQTRIHLVGIISLLDQFLGMSNSNHMSALLDEKNPAAMQRSLSTEIIKLITPLNKIETLFPNNPSIQSTLRKLQTLLSRLCGLLGIDSSTGEAISESRPSESSIQSVATAFTGMIRDIRNSLSDPLSLKEAKEQVASLLEETPKSTENQKLLSELKTELEAAPDDESPIQQRQRLSSTLHRASRKAHQANQPGIGFRLKQAFSIFIAIPKKIITGSWLVNKRSRTAYELREQTAVGSSVHVTRHKRKRVHDSNNTCSLFSGSRKYHVFHNGDRYDLVDVLADCIYECDLEESRQGLRSNQYSTHMAIFFLLKEKIQINDTDKLITLAAKKLIERDIEKKIKDATGKDQAGNPTPPSEERICEITRECNANQSKYEEFAREIVNKESAEDLSECFGSAKSELNSLSTSPQSSPKKRGGAGAYQSMYATRDHIPVGFGRNETPEHQRARKESSKLLSFKSDIENKANEFAAMQMTKK